MRPIDGDKLLTELMDSDLDHLQRDDWKEVIQIVQDAPTIQTQWIPCSERQPTEDGEYITTVEDGEGNFTTSNDWRSDWKEWGFWSVDEEYDEVWRSVTNVVAWAPLPEPYKGGGQDGQT